ncbi:MAG: threonine dehydratase [Betaproteobacteria bacterium]|nr:threonine dehydratase [Betaproteobacteria bacterium]
MTAGFALPALEHIEAAAKLIYQVMPPTPQYNWPLLSQQAGAQIWVKHENHSPIGAFKIRGGLMYFDQLARQGSPPAGVVSATRGNHGQSIGFAARQHGIAATIVVPHGNSVEKNAAMRALGVTLVEHGEDFQAAREYAQQLADRDGLHMVPSFHAALVAGVATYSMELLRAVPDLDVLYVPIGLGSGICGAAAARRALGHRVEIVGIVSSAAPAYARSFASRTLQEAPVSTRIADGMACRQPEPAALNVILDEVSRIVEVSDKEVEAAMAMLLSCTHNVAEGAGAAGLAAILRDRDALVGKRVAFVLSGGNVDCGVLASILAQTHR